MRLEQSFDVAAPLDRVWKALVDVEHVAPCLPGAVVTGRNEDGSYAGTFTVKVGPTTASYAGTLQMENVDESKYSATMRAHGSDKRGQGGADADIFSVLSPTDGGTHVEVTTDYHITGRLARFGRAGMIEDILERLLRQFAERLQASLAADETDRRAGGPTVPPAPGPGAAIVARPATEAEPAAEFGPDRAAEAGPGSAAEAAPGSAAVGPGPAEPAAPLDAVSLASSVIVDQVRKIPVPALFAGLLVGLLLIWGIRRRTA